MTGKWTLPERSGKPYRIAVVLPYINESIGKKIYQVAKSTLLKQGVLKKNIVLHRVPGALELPFVCQQLMKAETFHAIIALGVIIRGETIHFDLVAQETYHGLMQASLENSTPIICGVLAVDNTKQAMQRVRRGKDFALSALLMAEWKYERSTHPRR